MSVAAPVMESGLAPRSGGFTRSLILLAGLAGLVIVALLSLRYGSIDVSATEVWDSIFNYDSESYEQTAIRFLRGPRTVFALVVGCGLGVTGAVMQGVTRNPLADPFILGVSGGASLGITTAVYFGQLTGPAQFIWFAFGGAAAATALVYVIGSAGREGPTPIRLILSGVITGTLMSAWTAGLIYTDEQTRETMRYLLVGNVAGRDLGDYWILFPIILGGVAICLAMAHHLNVLNLGEDAARAVGMNTARMRLAFMALVVVVAGATVAAAGPIGFLGFAVPHIVRSASGPDYRWILLYAAVLGAIVLIGADLVGRVVLRPSELQAGIIMQALGAPFFVYMARRRSLAA
jgi:iron complex transport system permease protein